MPRGRQSKTHDQFLKDLWKKNKYYRRRKFKILGRYSKNYTYILCEDKHGLLESKPNNLLNGDKPDIRSAINPTNYFKNMLLESNEHYCNGEFWVIGDYINQKTPILCEDKYGLSEMVSNNLLRGSKPDIRSAINTVEYLINQFKEIHGETYSYDRVKYNGADNYVDIYCKVHKHYFPQTPSSHLSGQGCTLCKNNKIRKCRLENPSEWDWHDWERRGKESKNFDSFKLYIIKCWNGEEFFYKIGKTFVTVKKRFKNKRDMPYQYEIIDVVIGSAIEICELEIWLHQQHKKCKHTPKKEFHGMHECFSKIDWEIVGKLEKKK